MSVILYFEVFFFVNLLYMGHTEDTKKTFVEISHVSVSADTHSWNIRAIKVTRLSSYMFLPVDTLDTHPSKTPVNT